jgi:hypothetical protein
MVWNCSKGLGLMWCFWKNKIRFVFHVSCSVFMHEWNVKPETLNVKQ